MIVDTDHGYGPPALRKDGPAGQQAWVWKNLTRGNQTLFMDPYLAKIGGSVPPGRNHPIGTNPADAYFGLSPDPYWEAIRIAMGRARTYADRIDLAAMTPRGDLASTNYCLAHPGRDYLVYNPGPAATFDVKLAAGTYDFEWFDPTMGKIKGSGRLTARDGEHAFTAPFSGDAVLLLQAHP
jgi:hypothetical protein